MAKKFVKLVMVTEENNNKYYEMTSDGGPKFTVKYGRVNSTSKTMSYDSYKWDEKYNEKIKTGYKDVTHTVPELVADTKVTTATQYAKIADSLVDKFVTLMRSYTDKLVSATYSVKAKDVTQAQVDEAQGYLDQLATLSKAKKLDQAAVNAVLLKLYTIIPRYMGKVQSYLVPSIDLTYALKQEQDNLDAMASQVAMAAPKKTKSKVSKALQTFLDTIGVSMREVAPNKDLKYLLDQVGVSRKVAGIFAVDKPTEDAAFEKWLAKQKDKRTKILIHGTRCTSVMPILEQGLKIRPAGNFQFSGKAYGDGNYYSEVVQKSLGYTGYDNDKVLLVYEVHTGNPFMYEGWYKGNSFELNYKELQKRGFDSTYVKAGSGLLNSEIIAYNEEQNRIKYIIWLKN